MYCKVNSLSIKYLIFQLSVLISTTENIHLFNLNWLMERLICMPNFYVIHFSFVNDCYSQRIYLYINISLSCLRKLYVLHQNLSTIY